MWINPMSPELIQSASLLVSWAPRLPVQSCPRATLGKIRATPAKQAQVQVQAHVEA